MRMNQENNFEILEKKCNKLYLKEVVFARSNYIFKKIMFCEN